VCLHGVVGGSMGGIMDEVAEQRRLVVPEV
jgi:hypothetical protein